MKKIFVSKKQKMIVRVLSFFLLVLSILILGSCYTTPNILSSNHVPTEGSGYIYGRFYFLPNEADTLPIEFGESTIGIIVENMDDSKKHSFWLAKKVKDTIQALKGVRTHSKIPDDEIQMIAVPPGNYSVNLIEYLSNEMMPATEDFDMEGYKKDFVVEANSAVYIGDFQGIVGRDYNLLVLSLEKTVNNYDKTTLAALEKYPFLTEANITFVSNMMKINKPTLAALNESFLPEANITFVSNKK